MPAAPLKATTPELRLAVINGLSCLVVLGWIVMLFLAVLDEALPLAWLVLLGLLAFALLMGAIIGWWVWLTRRARGPIPGWPLGRDDIAGLRGQRIQETGPGWPTRSAGTTLARSSRASWRSTRTVPTARVQTEAAGRRCSTQPTRGAVLGQAARQGEGLLVTAGRRVWVSLYGHTSPEEFEASNSDREEADSGELDEAEWTTGGTAMLKRLLQWPRADVEIGVAIPIGCLAPLALAIAVLVGAGVVVGTRLGAATAGPQSVMVRVIDDGARGGPQILSTAVVPLR